MNTPSTRLKLLTISAFTLLASLGIQPSLHAKKSNTDIHVTQTSVDKPMEQSISQPNIEVVFVLDTTGSMSGLIKAAKEKIWSIAGTMAQAKNAPRIKMGLIAYRDRGDAYITKAIDLSDDLDSMYSKLMDFRAGGGGDSPESVNEALYDAVHKMSWSQEQNTYKVIFLVGDAPAHMDYQNDVPYTQTISIAGDKGVIVNAIQSGSNGQTKRHWQHVAKLGQGHYFQVGQSGNAVAIMTPFDEALANLSVKIDQTRLYYGSREEKQKQRSKVAASEKLQREASKASQARRASYNASVSGKRNFLGNKELVDEISSGGVSLERIEANALPSEMQAMQPAARASYVKDKAKTRQQLSLDIKKLAAKRDAYLKQKVEVTGLGKNSLDVQIFDAIREQSADKGLVYDEQDMKY